MSIDRHVFRNGNGDLYIALTEKHAAALARIDLLSFGYREPLADAALSFHKLAGDSLVDVEGEERTASEWAAELEDGALLYNTEVI